MFNKIFSQKKKHLIPYLTAGVPSLIETENLVAAMVAEGVEILELGVPFSDPSADGAVLQAASDVALKNNIQLKDVLELAGRLHKNHPGLAIVIFTYLNPLLAFGLENYVKSAVSAGVAATLTVDLPLEEADEYLSYHREYGLQTVFLSSPTTDSERLSKIQKASSAFLYYISRNGVTGEQSTISTTLKSEMQKIKSQFQGPVAVGFGITNADQAAEVGKYSDAVIIGSAYMRIVLEAKSNEERINAIKTLTRQCVQKLKD